MKTGCLEGGKRRCWSLQCITNDGSFLQGIECFDYSKGLNLVITGSLDHTVRVWNAYVSSKPVATLEGHATGVIGCKVHEGLLQVFTYSKDAVSGILIFEGSLFMYFKDS